MNKKRPGTVPAMIGTFCLATAVALGTTGCSKMQAPGPDQLFPPETPPPGQSQSGPTKPPAFAIYLDASQSMEGFIDGSGSGSTTYTRFLQELEGAMMSGWQAPTVSCARFGASVIDEPACDLTAPARPSFYHQPGLSSDTRVDLVLTQLKANTLSVIVTDLYQANASAGVVVNAIEQHVLSRTLALGLVAVRAEFDGLVCDAVLKPNCIRYPRLPGQGGTTRPFYAMVVGRQSDVTRLIESLEQRVGFSSDRTKSIVVPTSLVTEPLGWQHGAGKASLTGISGLREDDRFLADRSGTYPSFERHGNNDAIEFRATPSVHWGKAVPPLRPGAVRLDAVSRYVDSSGKAQPSAVSPTLLAFGPDASLAVRFPSDLMTAPGVYAFRLNFVVPAGGVALPFQVPEWCDKWSIDQATLVKGIADGQFDGSRTLGLRQFVDDVLRVAGRRAGEWKLGGFPVYVNVQ